MSRQLHIEAPLAEAIGDHGRALRQRREALGYSRQQLATIAECSIGSVALFEGGMKAPGSAVLPRIEKALEEAEGRA